MDDSYVNVPARILPNSPEAEKSVIGAMLVDNEAIEKAEEKLVRSDFYNQLYGTYFEAITELYASGIEVEPIVLHEKLLEKSAAPEAASVEFINSLIASMATSWNIENYCQVVKEKSILRSIIHVNQDIEKTCFEGKDTIDDILGKTEHDIFKLLQTRGQEDLVPISRIVSDTINNIRAASMNKGSVTGVPTGFKDLDYKTAGMQPSDLVLLAARPSMGKTALALNIAENVALKQNKCIAVFSVEMPREQIVKRLLSLETHIDAQKLRTGNLKDDEWIELMEGAAKVGNSNLIIDDTAGISITEMRTKCRKIKLEHPDLSMIIIDYLQLMTGTQKAQGESRQQEIAEISRSLKAIARELNVPVIALSQLSRAVEQRTDKRPMLSDLRESGAIEQDADVVMFIYRDEYYNKDSKKKGIAEVIIAKQRNGPTGTVELAWLPEYTKFADLERNYSE